MISRLIVLLKKERVSSFIYFSSASFIGAFIGIITLPFFTHYLDPEEFGIWNFAITFNSFISTIIVLDFHSFYLIEISKKVKNKGEILNSLLSFSVIWSVVLVLITLLIGSLFFNSMFEDIQFYPYIFYILISNVLLCFPLFLLIIYRIQKKSLNYFLFSLLQTIIVIIVPLIIVATLSHDAAGRVFGFSLATLLIGIFSVIILKRFFDYQFSIDFSIVKKAFHFSGPLIPYSIALLAIDFLDRIFIEKYCSTNELGLFGLANQINTIVYFIFLTIIRVYEPSLIGWLHSNKQKVVNKFNIQYMALLLIASLGLILFTGLIIKVLTNASYYQSADIIIKMTPFFFLKTTSLLLLTILISTYKTFKSLYVALFMLLAYFISGMFYIPTGGLDIMILIKSITMLLGCILMILFIGDYKRFMLSTLSIVFSTIAMFILSYFMYTFNIYF